MSIRSLALALLALGFVGSCADSPRPENASHRFDPRPTAEGTLHLRISPARTIQLRGLSLSEDPMQQITRLRFVFYGGAKQDAVTLVRERDIQSAAELADLALRLPIGDYRLIVIANPIPALVSLTQEGSPLSALSEELAITTTQLYGESSVTTLPMLNARGAVQVSKAQFDLSVTAQAITLEPLLARVLVYGDPELRAGAHKGKAAPGYLLTAQRRQLIPLRPLGLLRTGGMERYDDSSDPKDRYPKGPHYDSWAVKPPTELAPYFAYYSSEHYLDPERSWAKAPATLGTEAGWQRQTQIYAKESTLPPSCYQAALVPTVCYRYAYIPSGLTLGEGEGWLSFRGQRYSQSAFVAMLRAKSFPSQALREAVERAQLTEGSFAKAFEREGIAFYHKALNYYYIPIRHYDDSAAPTMSSLGRYGLVRGHEYQIKVTQISAPGMAVPRALSEDHSLLVEERLQHSAISVQSAIINSSEVEL